jgi:hypothetical protein
LFVAARAVRSPGGHGLTELLGSFTFDASKSWATNVAGIGAILGVVLGKMSILPAAVPVPLSNNAFIGLSVLYGLLLLGAPFVFAAFKRAVTSAPGKRTYYGYVWGFFLTAGLTLWALTGQLMATMVFLSEVSGQYLSVGLTNLFVVILVLAIVISILYTWTAAGETVESFARPIPAPATAAAVPPAPGPWRLP